MPTIDVSTKQKLFLTSKKSLIIYRGGVRSGKTFVACIKAVTRALEGRKQIILSNDYAQSRDVVIPTMGEVLDLYGLVEGQDYRLNRTDMDIIIRGTYVHLRSAEKGDRLRGISAHDGYIDESRNIKTRSMYDILLGRLSEAEDCQMHITSSPNGKDWTYDLAQTSKDCELIVQKTTENPFLPDGYVERLRAAYTSKFAAQELDADIIDSGGELFNRAWFRKTEAFVPVKAVRYWDLAVSLKTAADFSASVKMSVSKGIIVVHHVIRVKTDYPSLRQLIIDTAHTDGKAIPIGIESVGTQLGFVQDLQRDERLAGFTIVPHKPAGDKLSRSLAWATRAEQGFVFICDGSWNEDYLAELEDFSSDDSHSHDDQVDATSGAYELCCTPKLFVDLPIEEKFNEISLSYRYKGDLEKYTSLILDGTTVYVLKVLFIPTTGHLWVLDSEQHSMIKTLVSSIKTSTSTETKTKKVIGNKAFLSTSMKSISQSLLKEQIYVQVLEDYDETSLIYVANRLLENNQLHINVDSSLYGEMQAASDTVSPLIQALLHTIAVTYIQSKEQDKPKRAFDEARKKWREKEALASAKDGSWVNPA